MALRRSRSLARNWPSSCKKSSPACHDAGDGRHEQRVNRRNGYRERSIETRIGKLDLKIPKLRSGSCYPSFREPRKGSERALVAVVQKAYVKEVSTRKVGPGAGRWGGAGSRRAKCPGCARKSVSESRASWSDRCTAGGRTCGWMRPTEVTRRRSGGQSSTGGSGGSQRRGPLRSAGHGVRANRDGGVLVADSALPGRTRAKRRAVGGSLPTRTPDREP
jgi:hypothetical protein